MNDWSDQRLLTEFARSGSDPAFAVLVQRYIHLVHGTAVRLVCDAHLAEDLAQDVFLLLSREAARLGNHPALAGWLHLTTRNLAAKTVRGAVRRRNREEEVPDMYAQSQDQSNARWELMNGDHRPTLPWCD